MVKAFSYLRFSTPDQAKGDSTRRQSALAEAYAANYGLDLDDRSYRDLGVSGFHGNNVRTGALGQFLAAVDAGTIPEGSFLLVESLDRVSRQNPWDALPVFQQIINAGVTIVTLQDERIWSREEMRANPFRMFESIMVMIRAHEESATKSRRLRSAWHNKRTTATTKPMTARAPTWLKLVDRQRFEIVEERADVVRRIFSETLKGRGENAIAKGLNLDGVPVFGGGIHWHRTVIIRFLEAEAVIGTLVPHTLTYDDQGRKIRIKQEPVENYFPAIIDMSTWQAVRAMRDARNPQRGRHAGGTVQNVFGGLAKCAACGCTMTRVMKGERSRPSYVCTKAKTGAGCAYRAVPVETVEAALVAYMGREIEAEWTASLDPMRQSVVHINGEETKLQKQIDRLTDLIADGHKSDAVLERLAKAEETLAFLRKARRDTRKRLAIADDATAALRREQFAEIVTSFDLDRQAANLAARRWLNEVVIDVSACTITMKTKILYDEIFDFTMPPSLAERSRERVRRAPRDKAGRLMRPLVTA